MRHFPFCLIAVILALETPSAWAQDAGTDTQRPPQAAAIVPEPQLLHIQVVDAKVPPLRPGTETPWDPGANAKSEDFGCDLVNLGLSVVAARPVATIGTKLCRALSSEAPPDSDPSAPDPYVKVDFGLERAPLQSAPAPNTASPHWRFGFYVQTGQLPPAGLTLHLVDADRDQGEAIDSIPVTRAELLTAARGDQRLELQGSSRARISLIVAARDGVRPRRARLVVPANSKGEVLEGFFLSVGERVHVTARGSMILGPPNRFPPVSAAGSPDVRSRSYNLKAFAQAPFGALVMWLGQEHHEQIVIGSCAEFTATRAGQPVFAVNDSSRDSNSGELEIEVTATPPSADADLSQSNEHSCATEVAAVENAARSMPSTPPGSPLQPSDEGSGIVHVTAVRLKVPLTKDSGLPWDGGTPEPDPYVRIYQGGTLLHRTQAAFDRYEAEFSVALDVDPSKGPLIVQAVDTDLLGDDPIGEAILDLSQGEALKPLGAAGQVELVLQH